MDRVFYHYIAEEEEDWCLGSSLAEEEKNWCLGSGLLCINGGGGGLVSWIRSSITSRGGGGLLSRIRSSIYHWRLRRRRIGVLDQVFYH